MADEQRRVKALGLEAQQFEEWWNSPTTEKLRQFYRDGAAEIRASWARGEGWTEELRHRVETYTDFAELTFADIERFYDEREETSDEQA